VVEEHIIYIRKYLLDYPASSIEKTKEEGGLVY
jgi:hypothetical protein